MSKTKPQQLPTCLTKRVKDPKQLTEYYFSADTKEVRKLLVEEIQHRIEQSVKSSDSSSKYEIPNWDRYQADQVGFRRALREILSLLDR